MREAVRHPRDGILLPIQARGGLFGCLGAGGLSHTVVAVPGVVIPNSAVNASSYSIAPGPWAETLKALRRDESVVRE
jgi:hypothetical protein